MSHPPTFNRDDPPTLSPTTTRVSIDEAVRATSTSPSRELGGRRNSETSLSDTMRFYNVGGRPGSVKRSTSIDRAASPASPSPSLSLSPSTSTPLPAASTSGRPTVSYNTRPSSTAPSAHTASILPSASFFNPKRPVRSSAASPVPTAVSHNSRYSAGLDPHLHDSVRRTPNGPLITRVPTDYASRGEKLHTRRFSSELSEPGPGHLALAPASAASASASVSASASAAARLGSAPASRPASPYAHEPRPASADQDNDESAHGHSDRLQPTLRSSLDDSVTAERGPASKTSREPLLDFPSAAAKDANSSSPVLNRTSPRLGHGHSRSASDELKLTARLSVEGAVQRAKLSFSSMTRSASSENAAVATTGRPPHGAQQLPDVPSSGEYERSEFDARAKDAAAAARGRPAGAQLVQIPYEPVVDEKGRRLRNYQLHPGANRFFLGGRVVSSQDNPTPFLVSLVLAFVLPGAFFAFTAPYLWTHLGGGGKASIFVFAWLAAIMITNMCKTAWRDPGIIPRGLDRVPERKWVENLGEGEGGWKAEPKYMRIKEGVVASKWCETCGTYRPPRTSHCRLCDNCVEHTDHHCTFLNNCIGRRNYTSFFAFLVSSILCCLYVVAFSAWHLVSEHSADPAGWTSRWAVIGSFVVCVLCFLLLLPILGLFAYHMRLLYSNRTTIEMLRPKPDRSGAINPANGQALGNLYALNSPFANVVSILCRPMQVPSWISPHRYAQRDPRDDDEEDAGGAKE